MKKKTKFQQFNEAVVEKFVQMIDQAFMDFNADLLREMREEQRKIIDSVGINRDYRLAIHHSTFMYQAGIALSQSRRGKGWTPKVIAHFLYSQMTLTGIHPCPDVDYPKVERMIEAIRMKNVTDYQI